MAYLGQGAEGNFTTTNAKDTFSGNGSTTTFTLSQRGTENNVDVFVNNVRQEPNVAYNIEGNGTSLVFTAAPSSGTNNIYVVNRGPAELSASHPASQALAAYSGDFTTDVTIGGELDATTATFGGVFLGGTGSANKLDDYEEGTWTPYFASTSGVGTTNYSVQYGYYTKIGDTVYAHGRLQTSFWGTGGSGQLTINGLPHAAANNLNGYGSMVVGFTNNWVNAPSGGHLPPNQSKISLRKKNGTSAQADLDTTLSGTRGTDVNSVGNDIIFSITYKAS